MGTDLCLASAPRGRGDLGAAKEPGAVGPRASGPPGVEWAQGSHLSSWAGGVPALGRGLGGQCRSAGASWGGGTPQPSEMRPSREIRNVELLKLRFGEAPMHFCEVMLKVGAWGFPPPPGPYPC